MDAKPDEKWEAYPTTPGMGTSGWAFIRQKEGAYDFHGYVFGMNSYDGPNGSATLLAKHLKKMETTINALQQQLADAEAKAARYEEALRDVLDEAEMCELTDSGYCLRHASRPPCSTGAVLTEARALLNPPSPITPGEAQG